MSSERARLPLGRLHSMIAEAFRYGAELEAAGHVADTEYSYTRSEHHARELVREFIEGGHIQVDTSEGERRTLEEWAEWFDNPNESPSVAIPTHGISTPGYLLRAMIKELAVIHGAESKGGDE